MRLRFELNKTLMTLALLYVCGARADLKQELFKRCLLSRGTVYLQDVSTLFQQPETKMFLSNVVASSHTQLAERRLAAILLCRLDIPELSGELLDLVSAARKRPDVISGRPGCFCSILLRFTNRGPESKFVDEQDGTMIVGIIETQKYKKVEKYTDEDVRRGKARNAAARLAIVEYYLKFCDGINDYEASEMLDVLKNLECGGLKFGANRKEGYVVTKDLIASVYADTKQPLPIRIKALSFLPYEETDRRAVAALLFDTFLDETLTNELNKIGYRSVYNACEYFKSFGTVDDLARMREIRTKPEWRSTLVKEAIKEMGARLEKSRLER